MKQSQWAWTHTASCPAVKAKTTNSATVCPSVCLCLCVSWLLWPRKYCFFSHQLHLPAVMLLLSFFSSLYVIYILFSPFYSFSLRKAECREHKLLVAGEAGRGYWGFTFTVCTHPSSAVSALHSLSLLLTSSLSPMSFIPVFALIKFVCPSLHVSVYFFTAKMSLFSSVTNCSVIIKPLLKL